MSATAGYKLFTPLPLGATLSLKNRVVMSPMTRARADPETRCPREMNELYYEQRAGAGLIITEAVSISEQAHGWYGAPCLYNEEHVEAWKRVTDRVHAKQGKIFLQLWHIGRQGHPSFSPKNEVVSASALGLTGGGIRNNKGEKATYVVPRALETHEVAQVVDDYRKCAKLAKQAGFDGVEVHGANGYLVDQFLQSVTNTRTDKYGGSVENRARFLLEVVDAIKTEWDAEGVAVRLSPNGGYAGMGSNTTYDEFMYAAEELGKRGLAYLAVLDGVGFGYHGKGRMVTLHDAKSAFKGTVMANCSYDRDTAEGVLRSGAADLVSFARHYISTPDLAERYENDWPLNAPAGHDVWWDPSLGAKGLTNYPAYEA